MHPVGVQLQKETGAGEQKGSHSVEGHFSWDLNSVGQCLGGGRTACGETQRAGNMEGSGQIRKGQRIWSKRARGRPGAGMDGEGQEAHD